MSAPYAGARVSDLFRSRWKFGGTFQLGQEPAYVGAAMPTTVVEIRRGDLVRSFHPREAWPHHVPGLFGDVAGGNGQRWYPNWTPREGWIALGGVKDWRVEQSFDNNGVAALTMSLDNRVYVPQTGIAGLFHLIQEGYYSPLRGYVAPGRPPTGDTPGPFFMKLPNAQIRVRVGYGADTLTTVFLGLIDDLDLTATPRTMQVTGRDFGGVLLDQHWFGWAKERQAKEPVTFVPRRQHEDSTRKGGGAIASSSKSGYAPRSVTAAGTSGRWLSKGANSEDDIEWVQIKVPDGAYRSVYVKVPYDGMVAYVGIYARPRGHQKLAPCRFLPDDGANAAITVDDRNGNMLVKGHKRDPTTGNLYAEGWVDFARGNVPQSDSSSTDYVWPWFRHTGLSANKGTTIHFSGEFLLGTDSVIRIGFQKLHRSSGKFYASVNRFFANQVKPDAETRKSRWVPIDDVSQVVECCLRYAGFKNWEVEPCGVDLQDALVVDKAKTFMDTINAIRDQVGYVFFIAEPRDDNDDQDIGFPVFRENRINEPGQEWAEELRGDGLLDGDQVKFSNAAERTIIRVRGKELSKKNGGTVIGDDTLSRAMGVYTPPWAARMAGVIKHLTHYDEKLETIGDCQIACTLIALQIALAWMTATIAAPGTPTIGLDTYAGIVDEATGTNSRLYVTNRVQTFVAGREAAYNLELGGSMPDTPDIQQVVADYRAAIASYDRNDRPSNRERRKPHKHAKPKRKK